jgi:hypothetical protein
MGMADDNGEWTINHSINHCHQPSAISHDIHPPLTISHHDDSDAGGSS